ncbi:MAG: succinylglutamate desuccinylase/aspartoacylase family protein [Agarilytica sp.]
MLSILKSDTITLPNTVEEWLIELHDSSVIEIKGKNTDQWRVISTLIHGNEPSGLLAVFKLLQQKIVPETNLAIVISSVRAARQTPVFTQRFIPGEFDLNRRFGYFDCHDRVTELAKHITEYIRDLCPQFVVDLHNTSGNGPAFAVSISDHMAVRKMASLFATEMVVTQLVVGSLMEQNFNCPIVTIECGGAKEEKSHHTAYEGLMALATRPDVFSMAPPDIHVICHPVRIKAQEGMSLCYGVNKTDDVDITLIPDIEKLNYQVTEAGTELAWLDRSLGDCLTAINDHGEEVIEALFEIVEGRLTAKRNLRVFMATERADIALSDCIFYAAIV